MQAVNDIIAIPQMRAVLLLLASFAGAYAAKFAAQRIFMRLAQHTETDLDDLIVTALRRPIFFTALFAGLYLAMGALGAELGPQIKRISFGLAATFTIGLWTLAGIRVGVLLLQAVSVRADEGALMQPSNLPLFEILLKLSIVLTGAYLFFLAWHIDATAWVASAGIAGLALGFGAKDTLANLFAGIFIIADAPYKVGDFIVLDGDVRGRVTSIGMRSTRILTLDEVEVTVPNGIIGNSRIVNEMGGPGHTQRLRVSVGVAYGSDLKQVREVLVSCGQGVDHVCQSPAPTVHFSELGDSALNFQLLVWIDLPAKRDDVHDAINSNIYDALNAAGIEIPFNKYDVYLK